MSKYTKFGELPVWQEAARLYNGVLDLLEIPSVRNTPSWRLLERLGFRREGHLKKSLWFKRRWADEYVYAILAKEWLWRRQSLKQGSVASKQPQTKRIKCRQ